MFSRDLEEWFYTDEDNVPRYISPSGTIVIMLDPFETEEQDSNCWLWRVYDNGVPDLEGYDLLADEEYDHEFSYFDDMNDAYNDILLKGMERNRY
jgi:hypothetical protein